MNLWKTDVLTAVIMFFDINCGIWHLTQKENYDIMRSYICYQSQTLTKTKQAFLCKSAISLTAVAMSSVRVCLSVISLQ